MAPKEKAPPDPTRRDPSDILAKLEQLIKDRQPKEGESRSWVTYLIMGLLAIAGMAVFTYLRRKNLRELARLRHEHNKRKILANKAKVDSDVTRLRSAIEQMERKRKRFVEEMRIISADYEHERALHEANQQAIDRIRSWRDVAPSGDPGAGTGL